MPLSIKDAEADRLARALSRRTGETITQAVVKALQERLAREERKPDDDRHFSSLPVLDDRSDDEIIGYDENGLPT